MKKNNSFGGMYLTGGRRGCRGCLDVVLAMIVIAAIGWIVAGFMQQQVKRIKAGVDMQQIVLELKTIPTAAYLKK